MKARRRSSDADRPSGALRGFHALRDSLAKLLGTPGLRERLAARPAIEAFRRAAGDEVAREARALRLHRGVLDVEVESTTLLHDLKLFHATRLLEQVRRDVPSMDIRSIRFRLAAPTATR